MDLADRRPSMTLTVTLLVTLVLLVTAVGLARDVERDLIEVRIEPEQLQVELVEEQVEHLAATARRR